MNRFLKNIGGSAGEKKRIGHLSCPMPMTSSFSCRDMRPEALAWTKAVMAKLGLALNEAKTSLKDARTEPFDFLGYTFGPHRYCEMAVST